MRQMPSWSHAVRLRAEPASASRARRFVCLHLLSHDLQHVEDDLLLVASELVTNAILHAKTPFTVVLGREGPALMLIVVDLSPSVPVLAVDDAMDAGGRGLMVVDVLSSDWGVTRRADGSKSVWAAFAADDVAAAS